MRSFRIRWMSKIPKASIDRLLGRTGGVKRGMEGYRGSMKLPLLTRKTEIGRFSGERGLLLLLDKSSGGGGKDLYAV